MTLAVEKLSQRFGDLTALEDISFTLTGPKLVVILGPNGAGKTTLLDLLEGVTEPSAGSITLFGAAVQTANYPRRKIGVVMQKEFVMDGVTVGDYADLFAAIYEIPDGRKRILEEANLGRRAQTSVDRLSGGEAQRLFIAAASVHEPAVFFLDEPTSELDPVNKRGVGDALKKHSERALVVMTTHDLDEADRLADEVIFLLDGKLRAHGSRSEIIGSHETLSAAFFHYCGRTLARSGAAL